MKTSNEKNKKVITANGKSALRTDCRKIDGIYYLIGDINIKDSGECYEIKTDTKSVFYRSTNPNLIWDYSNNKYCLKSNHIFGIVDFENEQFTMGYFVPNYYNNILFNKSVVIDISVLQKAGLVFNSFEDMWVGEKTLPKQRFNTGSSEGYKKYPYSSFKEVYSTNEHSFFNEMQNIFNKWKNDNYKNSPFDKFFNNQTIGVEVETSNGNIPENLLYRHGLLPLKDGSIKGHEFTSVILQDKMFDSLKHIFLAAQENCSVNANTSLHYHIGNVKKSKEFVVALWMLYYRLQESIEALCPPYKRELSYLSNKRVSSSGSNGVKDHCKRMPNLFPSMEITDIDSAFQIILTFLNDGQQDVNCIDSKKLLFKHYKQGRPKWDFESRYYAINLIPLLFENKETVEFRFHSGTVNFYKGFAWALICSAILQYAQLNIEKILEGKEKIRLQDVIKVFDDKTPEGDFIVFWLLEYINERAKMHQKCILEHSMFGTEFALDNSFVFKIKGQCPLNFKS